MTYQSDRQQAKQSRAEHSVQLFRTVFRRVQTKRKEESIQKKRVEKSIQRTKRNNCTLTTAAIVKL